MSPDRGRHKCIGQDTGEGAAAEKNSMCRGRERDQRRSVFKQDTDTTRCEL